MAQLTYTAKTGIYVNDQSTNHGTVDVYGLDGPVKDTQVGIVGLHHDYANDIDMLLVGPDGLHNLVVMSDAGGPHGYGGFNFSFADSGLTQLGDPITSDEVYKPTDNLPSETASNWGLNIPVINHPAGATFASAFGGIAGNGNWSLYIHDDTLNDSGGVNGWNLTVTTDESQVRLDGGVDDDIIRVISSGQSEGVFEINERGGVAFKYVGDFDVFAGAGNDVILTANAVDEITAGSGRDVVHAGGGVDYLYVGDGEDEAGEVYDGGSGNDWLIHKGYSTLELRDDTVQSIQHLQFMDGGKVMVTASQASMLTMILGDNDITHPDVMAVTMGSSTGLDLGLINFNLFDQAGDVVTIKGDGDAETILGSKVNDVIKAAGGDDFIRTNLGRDTVDGGKGSDRVDYSDRSLAVTVTLKGSQTTNVKVDGVVEDSIKNVENVTGGSAGDVLKGDTHANALSGLAGADKLKGFGGDDKLDAGLGADSVWGGGGKDEFSFTSAVDAVDHLKDFSHADDAIVLDNAVFAAFINTGDIKAKMFHANDVGHDAHTVKQHLIYDKSDGSLWYDVDGNGAGAAVEFAVLDSKPTNLDFHDFHIV